MTDQHTSNQPANNRRSYRRTLVAIIWGAAILPVILLSFEFFKSGYESQQQVAQQTMENNVRRAVIESSQMLQRAMLDIDRMASDGNIIRSASFDILSERTIEQMETFLEQHPPFHTIMMVDEFLFQNEVLPMESLRLNLSPFEALIQEQFTSEEAYIDPEAQFAVAPTRDIDPDSTDQGYSLAMVRPILQPSDSLTQPFQVISTLVVLTDMNDLVMRSLNLIGADKKQPMLRVTFNDRTIYDTIVNEDNLVLFAEETLDLGNQHDQFVVKVALPNSEVSWANLVQDQGSYFLVMLFTLAVIFGIAMFLTRRLLQPITELRDISKSLVHHDFNLPTGTFANTKTNFREFHEVISLLERMSDKIGDQFDALNQYNQDMKSASEAMEASAIKANKQNDVLNTLMQYALFIQYEQDIQQIAALTVDTFSRLTKSRLGIVIYRNKAMKGCQVLDDVPTQFLRRINAYNRNFLSKSDIDTINDLNEGYELFPIYIKDEVDGYIVLESKPGDDVQEYAIQMFVTVLQSALEQEFLRLQLEKLANSDSLTGLFNRHYFDHKFALFSHRANTSDFAFGMMLIDVNGLKKVNDEIGHAAGDALIKRVALILKEATRQSDISARTGGDEFIVLLEQADSRFCDVLKQRLNVLADNKHFHFEGHAINVSFSIGYACTDTDPVNKLYELADARMYDEKQRHYDEKAKVTQLSHRR